jgi:hypothetical protein
VAPLNASCLKTHLGLDLNRVKLSRMYQYLMLHPDHMQKLYNQCVSEVTDSALPCEIILRAESDFTALINQHDQDPERFGAQVLQAQEDSVFLKMKYDAALATYKSLAAPKASIEELRKARSEVDHTHDEFKKSCRHIKILLSVISATSSV